MKENEKRKKKKEKIIIYIMKSSTCLFASHRHNNVQILDINKSLVQTFAFALT